MTEEEVDWNGSGVSTMHAVSQVSGQAEGDDDHKRLVSYFLQSCALGNKILAAASGLDRSTDPANIRI